MSQVVNVVVGLCTAFLGYLLGRAWQELATRHRHRKGRRFWSPFLRGGAQVVISRVQTTDFRDPVGLVGGGDAIAHRVLGEMFDDLGMDRPDYVYVDETKVDRSKNLILLGGPGSNRVTAEALSRTKVGLHVVDPGPGQPMQVRDEHETAPDVDPGDVSAPALYEADPGPDETRDYGVITRIRSPFHPQRSVVVIAGAYGYGTWAGALLSRREDFMDRLENLRAGAAAGDNVEFECLFEVDILDRLPHYVKILRFRRIEQPSLAT